jgi:hypothetical protein
MCRWRIAITTKNFKDRQEYQYHNQKQASEDWFKNHLATDKMKQSRVLCTKEVTAGTRKQR